MRVFQLLMNLNYEKSYISRLATIKTLNGMFQRHGIITDIIDEEEPISTDGLIEIDAKPLLLETFNVNFNSEDVKGEEKYTGIKFQVSRARNITVTDDNYEYIVNFTDFQISKISKYVDIANYNNKPTSEKNSEQLRLWRLGRLVYDNLSQIFDSNGKPTNKRRGIRFLESKGVEPNTIF